jgi:hybrid cluster-associated redox disulfide protein
MAKTITKEMIIDEVLKIDGDTAEILTDFGMHCFGCPSARGESLEDACMVHDIDVDELVKALNEVVKRNSKQ